MSRFLSTIAKQSGLRNRGCAIPIHRVGIGTKTMNQLQVKICQNCKNQFMIESEDLAFYERFAMPPPVECPRCRWRHLLAFFAFGRFRKTKSALSGRTIITIISPNVKFPIYDKVEFVGDNWEPLSYGRTYDPSRSFLEQFAELQAAVPHPHQSGIQNVNCDWCDDVWSCRECYLCRSLFECEYVNYGYRIIRCKNAVDLTYCFDTEFSYDCLYCFKCYKVRHSFDARDCIESMFLFDCRNCSNCFMCWNLRNKQYHILNKPYVKEEYFKKLKEFDTRTWSGVEKLKQEFEGILREEAVHRANQNVQVVNSKGNFLAECKNCFNCYFIEQSENARHAFRGFGHKETIDCVGSGFVEKAALSCVDLHVYDSIATSHSSNCRYSSYLDYCEECEYCFGCVGLRKKKHCVLNKQYTEGEYHKLTARIKDNMKKGGEWGRFFPFRMTYSGYNLSLANVFFPETRESVEQLGGFWDESEIVKHEGISGDELPEAIDEVSEDFTAQRIICPKTGLSFNIAPREFAFYKKHSIPLPRHHFDWRTLERFKPLALSVHPQKGICVFCNKEIDHYYSPELGYKKIACVECYQKEIL